MGKIFYIADPHWGHKNIINLCNRPFKSVEEMDETMIRNWNNVVTDEDDVYIIGDFIFRYEGNVVDLLKKLNGKKHLIVGNHEKAIMSNAKARAQFVSIEKYEEINDNGRRVILFHYPILEWNAFFRNSIHIYGHIHANEKNDTWSIMKTRPNAYNAGADVIGFTPRTLDELIQMGQ